MRPLLLSLLTITTVACAASSGDEGFVVLNNQVPGEGCTLSPDSSGMFQSRGLLFLNSPNPYVMTPVIQSRISALEGQDLQRTIALRGARVELEISGITLSDPGTGAVSTLEFSDAEIAALQADGSLRFTSLFSAPLAPAGTTAATFDAVSFGALAAIRAKVGMTNQAVHAQIVSKATLFGDLGGDEIEGVPFVYPITVCNDCIVNTIAQCPVPVGTTVRTGNACNAFQDGNVDCCTQPDGRLLCPAPVASM